jgi:hypothetical protein
MAWLQTENSYPSSAEGVNVRRCNSTPPDVFREYKRKMYFISIVFVVKTVKTALSCQAGT